jgi:hypothetical protein
MKTPYINFLKKNEYGPTRSKEQNSLALQNKYILKKLNLAYPEYKFWWNISGDKKNLQGSWVAGMNENPQEVLIMGPPGIEPGSHPRQGCILPLDYGPILY